MGGLREGGCMNIARRSNLCCATRSGRLHAFWEGGKGDGSEDDGGRGEGGTLGWAGLGWAGELLGCWTGLDWVALGWTGLDLPGLG